MFYSFGGKASHAKGYAVNDLSGRGATFHMALDAAYMKRVLGVGTRDFDPFGLRDMTQNAFNLNRHDIWVRKLSQAFASVCGGDTFLMVDIYNGKEGGLGIYQNPLPDDDVPLKYRKEQVWRSHEFPTLRHNDRVPKISSVEITNANNAHVDWTRDQNDIGAWPNDIDAMPLPQSAVSTSTTSAS